MGALDKGWAAELRSDLTPSTELYPRASRVLLPLQLEELANDNIPYSGNATLGDLESFQDESVKSFISPAFPLIPNQ